MTNPTIAQIQTALGDATANEEKILDSRYIVVATGVTEYNDLFIRGGIAAQGASQWVRTDATDTAANQAADALTQLY